MTPTRILALGATVMILYLAAPFVVRAIFPNTTVGYDTPLAGRVSGSFQTRHYHGFFLDGYKKVNYDLSAFVPAPPPGAAPTAADTTTALPDYLTQGDYLRKQAHSTELTVQRGSRLTHWRCPSPQPPH